MNYSLDKLTNGLKEFGISINDIQKKQFISFYEFLIEKNKVMNLTAITEFNDVVDKHFLDSLAFVKAFDEFEKISDYSLVDIGTGAGFPGIPIKIIFPEMKITLIDSLNKRIVFLNELIDLLGLKNIEAVHFRAEQGARNLDYREQFDIATSRAVANFSTLLEYNIPYVKKGGIFISYKSENVDKELDEAKTAIHVLGVKIKDVKKYYIPGTNIPRKLVVCQKEFITPKKYPRKEGIPQKNPL